MKWILFAIALIWIVLGTWANLYPVQVNERLRSFFERIAPRWAAVVGLAVGILLLIAAPASRQGVGFVRLLGLIAILKAVVFVIMSKERYKRLLDWWFAPIREHSWRVWGLLMLVLGVVMLSWL